MKELRKARIHLLRHYPFFAKLILYARFIETKDIDTAAIDNDGNIYYNPAFVAKLTEPQRIHLLAHEILHPALDHLVRGEGRIAEIWNIACDAVANALILDVGSSIAGEVPPQAGKTAEEVYKELLKNRKTGGDGDETGKGEGEEQGSKSKRVAGKEATKGGYDWHIRGKRNAKKAREWHRRVAEAYEYAKKQGSLPAGIEEVISALLGAKISWRQLLRQFVEPHIPKDFTFLKPAPQSHVIGAFYPSILKEDELPIAVAIDTSGSITPKEARAFFSEVRGLFAQYNGAEFPLLQCDATLQREERVSASYDFSKIKIKGRGGTDFRPVFEWLMKHSEIKCLVYFTDLMGTFPEQAPMQDIIWVVSSEGHKLKVPFGRRVNLEVG